MQRFLPSDADLPQASAQRCNSCGSLLFLHALFLRPRRKAGKKCRALLLA
jgi:hypothetical protein